MELKKYWEIIWRRKWILIQAMVFIPLFVYVLLVIISPIYKSEAKLWVRINTLQQKFLKDVPSELGKFEFTQSDNALGTIEGLLENSFIVNHVIRKIGLKDKNGNLFTAEKFITNSISIIFQKKGVNIDTISDADAFKIVGYSNEPSEARKIAEELIREFLDTFSYMYRKEIIEAKKIIKQRRLEVGEKLKEAERVLGDYRTTDKVYNIQTQITTLMTEISNLESARNTILSNIEEVKVTLKNIKEAPWIAEQVDFKDVEVKIDRSTVIDAYKSQLLTLETDLAKLILEKTQEHPDVKIVKQQIEVVKENIKKEISKLFAIQITGRDSFFDSIAQKYADNVISLVVLRTREKVLGEQIKERQKILNEIPEKERKFNDLSREVDNLTTTYNSLALSLELAESAEKMDLANAFIFQPPTLYEKKEDNLYFPPKKKEFNIYIVVASFLGIFFGLFFVFLMEYLDDSLWNPQEIEKNLNQKVIGVVPRFSRWRLNIRKIERFSRLDSVYNLIANIKLFKGGEPGKVISIISAMKGEGKSVLSSLMAITLAQQGKKVVLIDGNLRHPFLHHIFNLSNETGLGDYLLDNILMQETISSTSMSGLNVITGGAVLKNPQKFLDSDKFSALIKTLLTDYDLILFDTPAFKNGSDALIISKWVNDVLCVVAQGKTSQKDAKIFMESVKRANIKILGVILNKVRHL
jgi:capsular exopolysaccharide synthesis family protein